MKNKLIKILFVCVVLLVAFLWIHYATFYKNISDAKECNVLIEGVGIVETLFGPMESKWMGSGVVLNKNGLIITAKHCVEGAKYIQVTLHNGKTYRLTSWYKCDDEDAALFQLPDVNNLKCASLGDSNNLKSGTEVYAVGEAGGIWDDTVTFAKLHKIHFKRLVLGENTEFIFIKTSIAHGCSGGGLYYGNKLMGIVVMASNDGATFCVPINLIKPELEIYKTQQEILDYANKFLEGN